MKVSVDRKSVHSRMSQETVMMKSPASQPIKSIALLCHGLHRLCLLLVGIEVLRAWDFDYPPLYCLYLVQCLTGGKCS